MIWIHPNHQSISISISSQSKVLIFDSKEQGHLYHEGSGRSFDGLPMTRFEVTFVMTYQTNDEEMSGHVHNMAHIKLHIALA